MTNILDRVAAERSSFRPQTAQDFFALQLARKLNQPDKVHNYVAILENHPEDLVLRAYRNAVDQGRTPDLAERFQLEIHRGVRKDSHAK